MTKRTLLVDDDDAVRTSFASVLVGWGLEVVQSASARDALKVLAENPNFDLILCDFHMPETSGASFCEEIDSEFGTIPFILLSSMVPPRIPIKGGHPVAFVLKQELCLLKTYINSLLGSEII